MIQKIFNNITLLNEEIARRIFNLLRTKRYYFYSGFVIDDRGLHTSHGIMTVTDFFWDHRFSLEKTRARILEFNDRPMDTKFTIVSLNRI